MTAPFGGAKAALIHGTRLVVLRRDDIPTIDYPGMIDLPGGGREGEETPEETAARETFEETGLEIATPRFRDARPYTTGAVTNWFMTAAITEEETRALRLGDEGQAVWMMEIAAFLDAPDAIGLLKTRLRKALSEGSPADT